MIADDDIELFANGYYQRFRQDARHRAADQSAKLAACGDREGEAVWRRVAVKIELIAANERR